MIRPVDEYNKATDMYALGVLTQKVCGDFFTDITKPEWKAYNYKYYDAGADTQTPSQQKRKTANVYQDYLNSGRENMAYGRAFHQMRQRGVLP
ncbi:hypothetical protein R1sor_009540 [Riccia sorocarpa]|uniref:Uncharacterized protein n=1 Tax=Riccia sorocarpa TaxID=122646 RepID=A0ABD3I1J2_9MARC